MQLAGCERRDSAMRVHADGRGIENRVKEFRTQSTARHDFSAGGTRQFSCGFLATRTNHNKSACASERERRGTRRAARAEDQHAAPFDREFLLKRPEYADIIRVA